IALQQKFDEEHTHKQSTPSVNMDELAMEVAQNQNPDCPEVDSPLDLSGMRKIPSDEGHDRTLEHAGPTQISGVKDNQGKVSEALLPVASSERVKPVRNQMQNNRTKSCPQRANCFVISGL
ncbi:hypothetical protein A2U01_0058311, partial [Trifolium medium]|nr:hypothetical protein [Trifolium medium]